MNELRNFREGCKKYKNKDRGTEFAMTDFGTNSIILFSGMHRSCFCRSALLCRQGKNSYNKLVQHKTELKSFEPSPAFVMLTGVRKRLLPFTKREGSDSVISNNLTDTVFSRFTSHFSLNRKVAFTLAEVLITLGIIGIVAAMTLPTIISNYRVKVLENQFKKADSIIQQAIQKTANEYGYSSFIEISQVEGTVDGTNVGNFRNKITELNEIWKQQFLKANTLSEGDLIRQGKYCYSFSGKAYPSYAYCMGHGGYMVLPDGMTVSPISADHWANVGIISIYFDANGPFKGPNRQGYDIFRYCSSDMNFFILCNPISTHSEASKGCYYWAHRNVSPQDKSRPYWDVLYKPLSYWNK